MSVMVFRQFGGMVPKSPPELLPDSASANATNCDFSKNILGSLKGGTSTFTGEAGVNPIKGVYTLDGLYWYTWNTYVNCFKSPVIADSFSRVYYILNGTLYAAISPESTASPSNYIDGGNPPQQWQVGVPTPTAAPTLTLIDRTTLADYPFAALAFYVWWSDGTGQFGKTSLTMAQVTAFKRYSFTIPATPAGAPEGATIVVQAILTSDSGKQALFTLNTNESSTAPARSLALPGGVEMTLELGAVGATGYVNFSWGVTDTRAYVYTVQNTWNEESGPSPASIISPTYLQDVQVVTTTPNFASYRPYLQTNIYRTFGSNDYLKTNAALTSGTTYLDSSRMVTNVGVSLNSLEWMPPPTGLSGLVAMPNGYFAAFKDNILYMSEPYRPHTWQYSMTLPKSIRGMCVGPQALVVTTAETAYIIAGPHPASVNQIETGIPVGGVSHQSMCKIENGVVYVSNDGLVVVEGSRASLDASQNFWTREAWRDDYGLYLSSLLLGYHDGALVCVSNSTPLGFVIRLDEAAGHLTRFNYQFDALYRLPVMDTLYYAIGTSIYTFRTGTNLNATWNSKEIVYKPYSKLGIMYTRTAGTGTISLALYADGVLHTTVSVNAADGQTYSRLPAHRGVLRWQVQISLPGTATLHELAVAQTMKELQGV